MKRKDLENLRTKTVDELATQAKKLREEIETLGIDHNTGGKLKNINELRIKMKDRARVLTIMAEKKKGEQAVKA